MTKLIVVKFGGSALGPNGEFIPKIIQRIDKLKTDSKVIAVFSAPLTIYDEKKRSLTVLFWSRVGMQKMEKNHL